MFKYIVSLFLLAIVFIGCDKKDSEYFAEAENFVKTNSNDKALNSYKDLLEKYPNSRFAAKSSMKLAEFYTNGQANVRNLDSALYYYRFVIDNFPKSDETPLAIFMSAFIYNNEMGDFNKSKAYYEKFIAMYPEHNLVAAAKDELSTLGMTPEEILNQRNRAGN